EPAPVPPHARPVHLLLRLPAPGRLRGAGPGRLLGPAVRGHREAALHHRRLPGLAAAGAACGHFHPRLDAPPRPALGPAASGRVRHRRAGGAAFLVAGEIRHPRTGHVCGHSRPAARLARRFEVQGAPNHSSALSAAASRIAASNSQGKRTPAGWAGTGAGAAAWTCSGAAGARGVGGAIGHSITNRCWPSNTSWSPAASTASRTGMPLTTLP